MNSVQTAGFLLLMLFVTATIFFLWKIWHITFPHWRWREDHFGRRIKEKLTRKEWTRVKRYRLYFFLGMIGAFVVFGLLSWVNGGRF